MNREEYLRERYVWTPGQVRVHHSVEARNFSSVTPRFAQYTVVNRQRLEDLGEEVEPEVVEDVPDESEEPSEPDDS